MSLDVRQLRDFVVRPVLEDLGAWSLGAEQLVLGTAAQESGFVYLHQLGKGPALGLWQMEPFTYRDIWASYLDSRPGLARSVRMMISAVNSAGRPPEPSELVWNLHLACAMCRILYLRAPFAMPEAGDLAGMAHNYKRFYNSPLGAATEEEFVRNYQRLVEPVFRSIP